MDNYLESWNHAPSNQPTNISCIHSFISPYLTAVHRLWLRFISLLFHLNWNVWYLCMDWTWIRSTFYFKQQSVFVQNYSPFRQAGRQSVAFMDFDILQLVDVEIIINGKFIEEKQIVQPKKKQICYRLNVDSNEKLNKTK